MVQEAERYVEVAHQPCMSYKESLHVLSSHGFAGGRLMGQPGAHRILAVH